MTRLAFVIQRYGPEVNGGAEELCRQVAERLAGDFSIEVLTTCARDYLTWANHFPAGTSRHRGVRIRRFPVARRRKVRAFGRFSQKIYGRRHSYAQEAEWMERQGPDVPELYTFIGKHRDDYDLFVFFTYLYPPTFFGLPLVAGKSLLAPMAHDEPPLHLDIFRPLFHAPRGLLFNTEEERRFVHGTFGNAHLPWVVAGAGIDLPELPAGPSPPDDYLLYLGRVDVEKGCGELMEFFRRHKKKHPSPLKLILAGDINMKVPGDRDITPLGFVSEASKAALLRKARALVVPSSLESLSLSALEAWAAGIPVIASRGSRVLVEHMEKSGGGGLYGGFRDFSRLLEKDLSDDDLLRRQGLAGRRYVSRNYGWDRILNTYGRFFRKMAKRTGAGRADRY
jgi:glycosyltransferase involved in cell wall biosynthesis